MCRLGSLTRCYYAALWKLDFYHSAETILTLRVLPVATSADIYEDIFENGNFYFIQLESLIKIWHKIKVFERKSNQTLFENRNLAQNRLFSQKSYLTHRRPTGTLVACAVNIYCTFLINFVFLRTKILRALLGVNMKIKILLENLIFVEYRNFSRKWKFWSKIEILVENRNFGRKSKFWSKINIFGKHWNSARKSKFLSNIENFLENRNFGRKSKFIW